MEQSFLAWLRGRQRSLPQVELGIGDDAAVLAIPGGRVVVAVDTIIDGVDFILAEHGARRAGRKALAVNLSDLAAMAVRPQAAVVALQLPRENATRLAAEFYEGLLELAAQYEVALAGGDLSCYDGPLAASVTVLGQPPAGGCWLRSGARVGDAIVLSGQFGGSIAGHHLDFEPRVRLATALRERFSIRAAIDVSDGLTLDLDRLCAASGVGAELDLSRVPISDAAHRSAAEKGGDPLNAALGDGEDFELILAVPPEELGEVLAADVGVRLTHVGTFVSRTGLWGQRRGSLQRLNPRGYVHGVSQ